MNAIEKTMAFYRGEAAPTPKLNCAQSVMAGFAERVGMDVETAINVARGLGGGIGSNGSTCGAVCSAIAILGFKTDPALDELTNKQNAYERAREFMRRFEASEGATDCNDLLGVRYDTPEGRREAAEKGIHKVVCAKAVRVAAELLDDMLDRA